MSINVKGAGQSERNTLTFDKRYKLMRYVEQNPTIKDANLITQVLGFEVTLSNVMACWRDLGIKQPRSRKRSEENGSRIYFLAKSLISLQRQLGVNPPPEILSIVNKKSQETSLF